MLNLRSVLCTLRYFWIAYRNLHKQNIIILSPYDEIDFLHAFITAYTPRLTWVSRCKRQINKQQSCDLSTIRALFSKRNLALSQIVETTASCQTISRVKWIQVSPRFEDLLSETVRFRGAIHISALLYLNISYNHPATGIVPRHAADWLVAFFWLLPLQEPISTHNWIIENWYRGKTKNCMKFISRNKTYWSGLGSTSPCLQQ